MNYLPQFLDQFCGGCADLMYKCDDLIRHWNCVYVKLEVGRLNPTEASAINDDGTAFNPIVTVASFYNLKFNSALFDIIYLSIV